MLTGFTGILKCVCNSSVPTVEEKTDEGKSNNPGNLQASLKYGIMTKKPSFKQQEVRSTACVLGFLLL